MVHRADLRGIWSFSVIPALRCCQSCKGRKQGSVLHVGPWGSPGGGGQGASPAPGKGGIAYHLHGTNLGVTCCINVKSPI